MEASDDSGSPNGCNFCVRRRRPKTLSPGTAGGISTRLTCAGSWMFPAWMGKLKEELPLVANLCESIFSQSTSSSANANSEANLASKSCESGNKAKVNSVTCAALIAHETLSSRRSFSVCNFLCVCVCLFCLHFQGRPKRVDASTSVASAHASASSTCRCLLDANANTDATRAHPPPPSEARHLNGRQVACKSTMKVIIWP